MPHSSNGEGQPLFKLSMVYHFGLCDLDSLSSMLNKDSKGV